MKPLILPLTALLLCAGTRANTVKIIPEPPSPGDDILQIDTDLGIYESGPELWCCGLYTWSGSGIVAAIEAQLQLGGVKGFAFLPCPAAGGCDLTEVTFGSPASDPESPVSSVPEPATWLLVALSLLVPIAIPAIHRYLMAQRRNRTRKRLVDVIRGEDR